MRNPGLLSVQRGDIRYTTDNTALFLRATMLPLLPQHHVRSSARQETKTLLAPTGSMQNVTETTSLQIMLGEQE